MFFRSQEISLLCSFKSFWCSGSINISSLRDLKKQHVKKNSAIYYADFRNATLAVSLHF
jgi:hypothetical protein